MKAILRREKLLSGGRPELGDRLLKDTMCKEKRIKLVEREAGRFFLITMSKVTVPNENSYFSHCTLTHYEKNIGNNFFSHYTEEWGMHIEAHYLSV